MATSITSGTVDNSTDAGFRAWGSEFSSLLASVGLVKTSDTGQIDWSTVLKPTTANTAAGFEIWRFNDSLQATAPIFIRIEYGTANVASYVGMFITVGNATNGSGGITGNSYSARMAAHSSSASSTSIKPRYFCHTEGSLLAIFHSSQDNSVANLGFFITRSCDNTGALTGEAVAVYPHNSSSSTVSSGSSIVRFNSGTVLPLNAFPVIVPNGLTSSAAGVDKQVFPHFASYPRVTMLPSILTVFINDFVDTSPVVIDIGYGPRTFIPIKVSMGPGVGSTSMANGITCLAYLWE